MTWLEPIDLVSDHLFVRLFEVRARYIDGSWNARDVMSSYWRMYLNGRDGAALQTADRLYPIHDGEIVFVPAWVTFTCLAATVIQHFYVHFDIVGLPGAVVRDVFARPISIGRQPTLMTEVATLGRRLGQQPPGLVEICLAKALVHRALATLFDQLGPVQAARCREMALGDCAITPAVRYIEEHLAEPLANSLLARLSNLGEDHFIRVFRQFVGQTPAQYVQERRVATAAQMLVFGSESIERIAARTGFGNRHYFSRVFVRRMGVAPAAYRRARRV